MYIKIFQINMERDDDRVAFMGIDWLETSGKSVHPEIYDKVFEGEVACNNLEEVFEMFNMNKPEEYAGRSLSVSDVVSVKAPDSEKSSYHYCDSFGFKEIAFDEGQTDDPANSGPIRVVFVEPGREARIMDVEPTLECLYKVIDTDIIEEVCPFDDNVCILCDEEGKIKSRDLNRALRFEETGEIYDVLTGPFIVCAIAHEHWGSLSEDQQKKYLDIFQWPEKFLLVNGEVRSIMLKPRS